MHTIKLAIVYQVVFHYRIPFYERIFSDPDFTSILFHGNDNPYNKSKNYDATFKFQHKKLNTIFIPYGKEDSGIRKVMPLFPNLLFRLFAFRPDVILCEGTSALPNALISFIYCRLFRKPFIWWSLGRIKKERKYSKTSSKLESLITYLECNASAIFTYSTTGKNYFVGKGVDPEKVFVGVNVIDTNKRLSEIKMVIKNCRKDKNIFQILFVGAILKEKHLEILIDAFNMLCHKYSKKVNLVIVGDGSYLANIKEYAQKTESENILFTGKIIEGVSRYFLESDVFVLPGLGGLAISDAMVHGLPVITSTADGTEIDLVTTETGFLLDNMTVENLFNKLELLFLNPRLKEKLSSNSKKIITTLYSFDNYYNIFKDSAKYVLKS